MRVKINLYPYLSMPSLVKDSVQWQFNGLLCVVLLLRRSVIDGNPGDGFSNHVAAVFCARDEGGG